ncbi:MAG: transcriptional repressor LexA [Bacillota bacterium]
MGNPRGESQEKIFAYIRKIVKAKGYPPSVREICEATGLRSTSTVHAHLKRLEKKGLISRDSMKPRAISLTNELQMTDMVSSIPIVGRVTAGVPILASENIEEYISIPNVLLGDGEHYILGVRGDSMINAGIMDGDFVVVKKQQDANNGDIVVAMIDDDATVKRFFRDGNQIRLQPENQSMAPILCKQVTILGKVVSLYRLF